MYKLLLSRSLVRRYMLLQLDLTQWQPHLRLKKQGAITYVWDTIRRKYLVLQPEELVRQLLILHLTHALGYSIHRIQVEQVLKVAGRTRRFDILVLDKALQPYLLIECKAPNIPLDQSTLDQASAYNYAIKAPFLLATNGLHAYVCAIDFEDKKFTFLAEIPAAQ